MPHAVIEIFLVLCGACVGSFLNVVIYRLPAGLSVARPARSFCPRCRAGIAWYDNLPVLSWFLLRGRCRHCAAPISVQYPLVEAVTGLAFVLVYHLLFVAASRDGLEAARLPRDLPLLLTWLVLVSGLIACAAMDIVSYSVDVRVTLTMLLAGALLHAVWPREGFLLPVGSSAGAAASLAALALGWLAWQRLGPAPPELPESTPPGPGPATPEPTPAASGRPAPTPAPATAESQSVPAERESTTAEPESTADEPTAPEPGPAPSAARPAGALGAIACLLLVAALVYAGLAAGSGRGTLIDLASGASLAAIFLLIVLAGGQQRPADHEIRAAIEQEQPTARRTACRELLGLLPVLITWLAVLLALSKVPALARTWDAAAGWRPGGGPAPLGGLAFALHGAVVGAAAGWLLRIVFTLAFGREAFGVGDIHILAAAGAAGGWDIALLGLVLSVLIALAGWLVGLALKATALIPFGPWLALGFVGALGWNRPAAALVERYRESLAMAWAERPDLVLVALGLVLVGSVAAVVLARGIRRWVAPDSS